MVHVGVGFTTITSSTDANIRRITTPDPPAPPTRLPAMHMLEFLFENNPVGHAEQKPELFR